MGIVTFAGVLLTRIFKPELGLQNQVVIGLGYISLAMLVFTLLYGPYKLLKKRHLPVNYNLRRDVGIWTAGTGKMGIGERMPLQIATDDSSFLGWLTVSAYLMATVLCEITTVRIQHIFRDAYKRQHQLVWGLLTVAMLFLGFNKQLDLQTPFTHLVEATFLGGKELYEVGETTQFGFSWFIGGLVLVGLVSSIGLLWYMRHVWRHYWLLALGVLFIARFVVVRAAGFYGVELPPLSQYTGGVQINWLLEFLGVAVIAATAGINLWRSKSGKDRI